MKHTKILLFFLAGMAMQVHARFEQARTGRRDERKIAYDARRQAAFISTLNRDDNNMADNNNGDETELPKYVGSFHKLLPHDNNGILTEAGVGAYNQLLKAISTEKQSDWNAIQRTTGTQRKWANPQAAFALTLNGEDSACFVMYKAPKLQSGEAAADQIETYLNAVCRDVKFWEYGTGTGTDVDPVYGGSLTAHAAAILDDLGDSFKGPRDTNGHVTAKVLFRGLTPGDLTGTYNSQFILLPVFPLFVAGCVGPIAALTGVSNLPISAFQIDQTFPIQANREFGVSWADYISIQNGFIPKKYDSTDYSTQKRYPINGRDLTTNVHRDGPYEPYYNAVDILLTRSFPLSPVLPYVNGAMPSEGSVLTMGGGDLFGLMGTAALTAFRAAWCQKWRGYRRLRPEAMGGLVHKAKVSGSNPYNLHASLFQTHNGYDYLKLVKTHNQKQASLPHNAIPLSDASTYLLSQCYPEASPEHPSYPSGHATGAGACITIIKAFFKESELIADHVQPVKVNPNNGAQLVPLTNSEDAHLLTVGGELNKLAFQISMARDFAGVHWRSDAWNGMLLGEAIAISVLQDHARIYQEEGFTGFELTKLDGHKIRITPDEVIVLS